MKIIDVSIEEKIDSFYIEFYISIETNHGKYQIDDYGFCTTYELNNNGNDQKHKNRNILDELVGELFFVNINKSCKDMTIDELKNQSDLLEKPWFS